MEELSWTAHMTSKQFTTKRSIIAVFVLGIALTVFTFFYSRQNLLLKNEVWLFPSIIIFIFIVFGIYLIASRNIKIWFKFTITENSVIRINSDSKGNVNVIGKTSVGLEKFYSSMYGRLSVRPNVTYFNAVKGYREEKDRFVLVPKVWGLSLQEFTVIPNNNKDKIRKILDKHLKRLE